MTPDGPQAIDAPPSVSPAGSSPAAAVFAVRAYRSSDLPFVRDSWLRSAWDTEKRAKKAEGHRHRALVLAGHAFYALNRPKVTALLVGRDALEVLVACAQDDDDHIGAWLAHKDAKPSYAYVKAAYRGWGLVRLLASTAGVEWGRRDGG